MSLTPQTSSLLAYTQTRTLTPSEMHVLWHCLQLFDCSISCLAQESLTWNESVAQVLTEIVSDKQCTVHLKVHAHTTHTFTHNTHYTHTHYTRTHTHTLHTQYTHTLHTHTHTHTPHTTHTHYTHTLHTHTHTHTHTDTHTLLIPTYLKEPFEVAGSSYGSLQLDTGEDVVELLMEQLRK